MAAYVCIKLACFTIISWLLNTYKNVLAYCLDNVTKDCFQNKSKLLLKVIL